MIQKTSLKSSNACQLTDHHSYIQKSNQKDLLDQIIQIEHPRITHIYKCLCGIAHIHDSKASEHTQWIASGTFPGCQVRWHTRLWALRLWIPVYICRLQVSHWISLALWAILPQPTYPHTKVSYKGLKWRRSLMPVWLMREAGLNGARGVNKPYILCSFKPRSKCSHWWKGKEQVHFGGKWHGYLTS